MRAAYPLQSVAAASGLAILTIAVFAVSQGRGPSSVIQQYHKGLIERDATALDRLTVQPRTLAHSLLEAKVLEALSFSEEVQIGRAATRGRAAAAPAVYSSRFGVMTVVFVFRQDRAGWIIDPVETLSRTRESSRF